MIARRLDGIQTATQQARVPSAGRARVKDNYILNMPKSLSPAISIFFVIVICVSLIYALRAYNTQMGYELVDMQKNVVSLNKSNEMLKLDTAELKSPSRIQAIATKSLGMVMPNEFVYSSDRASAVQSKVVEVQPIVD